MSWCLEAMIANKQTVPAATSNTGGNMIHSQSSAFESTSSSQNGAGSIAALISAAAAAKSSSNVGSQVTTVLQLFPGGASNPLHSIVSTMLVQFGVKKSKNEWILLSGCSNFVLLIQDIAVRLTDAPYQVYKEEQKDKSMLYWIDNNTGATTITKQYVKPAVSIDEGKNTTRIMEADSDDEDETDTDEEEDEVEDEEAMPANGKKAWDVIKSLFTGAQRLAALKFLCGHFRTPFTQASFQKRSGLKFQLSSTMREVNAKMKPVGYQITQLEISHHCCEYTLDEVVKATRTKAKAAVAKPPCGTKRKEPDAATSSGGTGRPMKEWTVEEVERRLFDELPYLPKREKELTQAIRESRVKGRHLFVAALDGRDAVGALFGVDTIYDWDSHAYNMACDRIFDVISEWKGD
jgi:hypothetical protein